MKKLIVPSLIFLSITINAQLESIYFSKDNSTSSGKIIFINKKFLGFYPSQSTDDSFKTNKGEVTFQRRKTDRVFLIPKSEISLIKSTNKFKEFLIESNSKMNLLEDRLAFDERNISKFRKLQLTARWMSIFGVAVGALGTVSSINNTSGDSNPRVFAIGGLALSGLSFIIDLSSFSKLKFEKHYKKIDESDGYCF